MNKTPWHFYWAKYCGIHILPYLFVCRTEVMAGWLCWEIGYSCEEGTL